MLVAQSQRKHGDRVRESTALNRSWYRVRGKRPSPHGLGLSTELGEGGGMTEEWNTAMPGPSEAAQGEQWEKGRGSGTQVEEADLSAAEVYITPPSTLHSTLR